MSFGSPDWSSFQSSLVQAANQILLRASSEALKNQTTISYTVKSLLEISTEESIQIGICWFFEENEQKEFLLNVSIANFDFKTK